MIITTQKKAKRGYACVFESLFAHFYYRALSTAMEDRDKLLRY